MMSIIDLSKDSSLVTLMYKTVRITTTDGKLFEGQITSYCAARDSDDGMEDIGIEFPDRVECFDETMIESIEEISEGAFH